MKDLTTRQKQMLSIIHNYIQNTGYPPTMEEMREALQVSSNQSVIDLLNHLERKKCIRRKEGIARSVAILPFGYEALGEPPLVPFLGVSHAGSPVDTIQIEGEWQQVSSSVSFFQERVYLVKVDGDSMINAGIENGDTLLVQEKREFISGDIVLAQIGDETTVKRFVSEDKPPYLYLKPENPNYKIIYFTEEVELKGKIIGVVKNGRLQTAN